MYHWSWNLCGPLSLINRDCGVRETLTTESYYEGLFYGQTHKTQPLAAKARHLSPKLFTTLPGGCWGPSSLRHRLTLLHSYLKTAHIVQCHICRSMLHYATRVCIITAARNGYKTHKCQILFSQSGNMSGALGLASWASVSCCREAFLKKPQRCMNHNSLTCILQTVSTTVIVVTTRSVTWKDASNLISEVEIKQVAHVKHVGLIIWVTYCKFSLIWRPSTQTCVGSCHHTTSRLNAVKTK